MASSGWRTGALTLQREYGATEEGRTTWSRVTGRDATWLCLCVRPTGAGDAGGQAAAIYRSLDAVLQAQGVSRRDVITEKVFLADVRGDVDVFRAVRDQYYLGGNGHPGPRPATTYVQQPPATPGVRCELQARVISPIAGEPLVVRDVAGLAPPAAGKVVSARGYEHVFLRNITGGVAGDGMGYAEQTAAMFAQAAAALARERLGLRDMIRTWIYVTEMERDYAALNRVRTAVYADAGVKRLPASTGIQGGVYPADRGGALDVYALRAEREVEIGVMHAPTLNEAWSYGSAFSRGLWVRRDDRLEL